MLNFNDELLNTDVKEKEEEFPFELVGDKGIRVLDPKIRKQIDKLNISASTMNNFLRGPADFILDRYLLDDVSDKSALHLDRGNWFHSIMEEFFRTTEPSERTLEALSKSKKMKKLLQYGMEYTDKNGEKPYAYLYEDPENIQWIINGINNYFKNMPEQKPENEKVAVLSIHGRPSEKALEFFVRGTLGDYNRNCVAFIDKVIEGEDGLIIQDWKTGKNVEDFDPDKPIGIDNSFDYWRQQIFYAMLLEDQGCVVTRGELIFPMANPPTTVRVSLAPEWREQVIRDINRVNKQLDYCIEHDYFFPFLKGKYNGWSSFLGGNQYGYGKLWNVRYDELPYFIKGVKNG